MDISNPVIAYFAVFIAGLIASVSPCTLIIFPMVIGYVGGYSEGDVKKSAVYSFMFSLGLAVTFTILGAIASLTGSLLGNIGGYWKYILAAVAMVMGLQMLGALKFQIPAPKMVSVKQRGTLGAFMLGLLFGLAASPCATPMLAVILTYAASQQNVLYGISLLFVYALAYSVLVFVVGISTGAAESVLQSKVFQKVSIYAPKISGLVFILAGLLILWQLR